MFHHSPLYTRQEPLKPINKSSKLADVCYDIRGPVLEMARKMEDAGQPIMKLNIGNLAAFGLDAPDDVIQGMIRDLPKAAGYTDSKGLIAPREAVVRYSKEKQIPNVTADDVFLGNGASELITMSLNALLNRGDEILVPAPDYPLWTAATCLTLVPPSDISSVKTTPTAKPTLICARCTSSTSSAWPCSWSACAWCCIGCLRASIV